MSSFPLVLLAPSEEKAGGGVLGALPETPAQRWVRTRLAVLARKGTPEALVKAFAVKGLPLDKARSEALALAGEVPLLPALARYAGVAFRALDARSLPAATWRQVFILSSLRGLVRGDEPLPPYKLKLQGILGLKAHWRKALGPLLEQLPEGEVWDLLPGEVADLLKDWQRPRHRVDILDARGKAVGHFAKTYRGRVAHWILVHQEGDPRQVVKGRIPGARWVDLASNEWGGVTLQLEVEP